MERQPSCRILLIGGSSGTGKTELGRALSREFRIPLLLVDDVRMAIQAVTTPEDRPDLHVFIAKDTKAFESPEAMCEGLIKVAAAIEPALHAIMAHHIIVDGSGPIIMEGDGILPRLSPVEYLLNNKEFHNSPPNDLIRSLFLHEPDKELIHQNMLLRGRGFREISPEEQRIHAEGSWLFGKYLVEEARRYNLEIFTARPYDDLLNRVISSIAEP